MPRETAKPPPGTGLTMRVAAGSARNHGTEEIVKAGELIDITFDKGASLTLFARRSLNLMLAVAAGDGWKDRTFSVTKRELRQGHKGNERIDAMLDELMSVKLKIDLISPRGRPAIMTAALLSSNIEEKDDDDDSLVHFRFTREIATVLKDSDHYALLIRKVILAFDSKYALALYEIGAKRYMRRDPTETFPVPRLRELLGVPAGAIKNWTDLRRTVLDQAKAEIDQLADFTLTWREQRQGRKVVAVELAFWRKDRDAVAEAARERARPRVGRKARRAGTVETIPPDDTG